MAWWRCTRPAASRAHQQRMDDRDLGGGEPFMQVRFGKLVHQKADGATVHTVDRLAGIHEALQGREHETIAAERDDHVGGLGPGVTVTLNQPPARLLRFRHSAGDKGNALVACCGGTLGHKLKS